MQLFYAMGGTLHPRLNMPTISNTPTCTLSQFYDWLICRNVSMIDSWDCCYHFLLVEGVRSYRSLVAKTQYCAALVSRGGWYQVTVSLLPPLQPSPRYDLIRYTQYRFRYDTDPIIVRSLSGGNNFNNFPDNELTKYSVFIGWCQIFIRCPLNFYESLHLIPHRMDTPDRHNKQSDKWMWPFVC